MLGTAGCSRSPDARQVLDTLRSWTATVRVAGEQLRAGATTAPYTAELRDDARKALAEAPPQVADRRLPADTARQLRAASDSLAAAIHQLDAELPAR